MKAKGTKQTTEARQAWLLSMACHDSPSAPGEPIFLEHVGADWRGVASRVALPPFVALPASCEQLADGLMERLSAASATEQADLADELTRLANSTELVNWEALAEGRFETLRGGKKSFRHVGVG